MPKKIHFILDEILWFNKIQWHTVVQSHTEKIPLKNIQHERILVTVCDAKNVYSQQASNLSYRYTRITTLNVMIRVTMK